jgi:hypothetical protein
VIQSTVVIVDNRRCRALPRFLNQSLTTLRYPLARARQKVTRATSEKQRAMSRTSADLIRGWEAERTTIEQRIASLSTGAVWHALAPCQREATTSAQMKAIAELDSLIADFSRCEVFPVAFAAGPRVHPTNQRMILPQGSSSNGDAHPARKAPYPRRGGKRSPRN